MLVPAIALAFLNTGLEVTNFEPGELVRYPVVLLKGNTPGTDVIAGLDWKKMNRFPAVKGKFNALVELKTGINMVLLQSANQTLKIRIDYRPATSPYKVQAIYIVPKDESSSYEGVGGKLGDQWGEKLDTALKLMQTFTADAMNDAGYGRKTFTLDLNEKGKVKVNVLRSEKTGAELRAMDGNALWSYFYGVLEPKFPFDVNKCCAIMSFSRYDRTTRKESGHTALGGGGLGLFGGASMWAYPTSLSDVVKAFSDATPIDPATTLDDTGYRSTNWATAATGLGAMLHEMGHTFGLPHSVDPEEIMSRGFDHFNRRFMLVEPPCNRHKEPLDSTAENMAHWSPFFAARLNSSPWFQPDGNNGARFATDKGPTISFDKTAGTVKFEAPHGLRVVGAELDDHPSSFRKIDTGDNMVVIPVTELQEAVGSKKLNLYAIDSNGIETRISIDPEH